VDTVPVWLMRQAGRYLPGYRALRARHTILEIARTPPLAAEVSLEPLREFDLDAAVIFADIVLPLAGLGVDVRIDAGVGPVVPRPVRSTAALDSLRPFDAEASVGFVAEAIREFRAQERERPLIGFAGAPFTLATYLIEGAASRELPETRRMLYAEPDLFGSLLDRLTAMTVDYLRLQARAGADVLQLFDTWVGVLGRASFQQWVLPRVRAVFDALRPTGRPMIYFSTESGHLTPLLAQVGADALGVDWRTPLGEVRAQVGPAVALQGNLDPGALLGNPAAVREGARSVLDQIPDRHGHVFNLGHGVLPTTAPERVRDLVEFVHAYGRGEPR
jgi:uroporphyrinogen decarboxylase